MVDGAARQGVVQKEDVVAGQRVRIVASMVIAELPSSAAGERACPRHVGWAPPFQNGPDDVALCHVARQSRRALVPDEAEPLLQLRNAALAGGFVVVAHQVRPPRAAADDVADLAADVQPIGLQRMDGPRVAQGHDFLAAKPPEERPRVLAQRVFVTDDARFTRLWREAILCSQSLDVDNDVLPERDEGEILRDLAAAGAFR
ncbi:MAG: hypothetical protein JW809_02380 [Pirellulales bacterium]|nr:hypothetical protein [Pirellulales bacterium]